MNYEREQQIQNEIAFPRLPVSQIDALRPWGHVRDVIAGEVLFAEGDRGFCFYVVLNGAIEIVEHSRGAPHVVTMHEPGEFTGDVDMLSGRVGLVTARVARDGQVLELDASSLRRAAEDLTKFGEIIVTAFLARRTLLLSAGFEGIKIIGSRFSPNAHRLRDFATRNAIPFTWIDLESDKQAELLLQAAGVPVSATPVVIGRDGHYLSNPSVAELGRCAGLDVAMDPEEVYDLVVVGAGPAGLAASVYAASEGLDVLTVERTAIGGQAGTSSRIENYLGFPAGISGAELTRNALLQAQKFGARITVPGEVTHLRLDGGSHIIKLADGTEVHARCVLAAVPSEALDTEVWRTAGRAPFILETIVPGVFAAGDVRSLSTKRVAAAV